MPPLRQFAVEGFGQFAEAVVHFVGERLNLTAPLVGRGHRAGQNAEIVARQFHRLGIGRVGRRAHAGDIGASAERDDPLPNPLEAVLLLLEFLLKTGDIAPL